MVLILATEEDSLAHAVCRVARRSGTEVLMCSNAEILGRDESDRGLLCGGRRVSPAELEGVLFRLRPCWWRTAGCGDDHDLIGAWYTLLWNLPCPVVNRLGLSWWFDPEGYAVQLSLHLTAALTAAPSEPVRDVAAATVYIAGSTCTAAAAEYSRAAETLQQCGPALMRWQKETGIYVAKVVVRGHRTASVDPNPDLARESPELVEKIAEAVCSTLTRTQ